MAHYDAKVQTVADNRSTDMLEAWRREQPLDMTDTRRLLAATYLTAIVHERDFM